MGAADAQGIEMQAMDGSRGAMATRDGARTWPPRVLLAPEAIEFVGKAEGTPPGSEPALLGSTV